MSADLELPDEAVVPEPLSEAMIRFIVRDEMVQEVRRKNRKAMKRDMILLFAALMCIFVIYVGLQSAGIGAILSTPIDAAGGIGN